MRGFINHTAGTAAGRMPPFLSRPGIIIVLLCTCTKRNRHMRHDSTAISMYDSDSIKGYSADAERTPETEYGPNPSTIASATNCATIYTHRARGVRCAAVLFIAHTTLPA